jgi:hypothetical protein
MSSPEWDLLEIMRRPRESPGQELVNTTPVDGLAVSTIPLSSVRVAILSDSWNIEVEFADGDSWGRHIESSAESEPSGMLQPATRLARRLAISLVEFPSASQVGVLSGGTGTERVVVWRFSTPANTPPERLTVRLSGLDNGEALVLVQVPITG